MASRRDQKERLKAERLERERQAQAAERRKRLVGYGAGGVLAVAALVAVIVVIVGGGGDDGGTASAGEFPEGGSVPAVQETDLETAARQAGCVLKEPPDEGSTHIAPPETVNYRSNPPTSGDHYFEPAEEAAYSEPPPTEALVHSLEHGRILIQYRPDAPESAIADLKALYDEDPYHVILAPNQTDMPYEAAATTWGHLLGCREMNEDVFDAIRAFKDEYRDTASEEGFIP